MSNTSNEIDMRPCLNCEDRILGCHSTCEKYIAYKNEITRRRNLKIKRLKDEEYFIMKNYQYKKKK